MFARSRQKKNLKILNGATASETFVLGGHAMLGLYVPAEFDGASVAVHVSVDGSTFGALIDATGAAVSKSVTANSFHELPTSIAPFVYMRLISNIAQTGDTTFVVIAKA